MSDALEAAMGKMRGLWVIPDMPDAVQTVLEDYCPTCTARAESVPA